MLGVARPGSTAVLELEGLVGDGDFGSAGDRLGLVENLGLAGVVVNGALVVV